MTEAIQHQPASVPAATAATAEDIDGTANPSLPSNHPKYRADIDGLRAIAVLSVVIFHAAPGRLPGGFVGVDIFFVISGFLISSIILKALQNNRFSFIEFYSRRIKRIFPALLVVLTTCLGVGYFVLTDDELKELSKHVAGGAGFVSNIVLWTERGYFDDSADFKPLLHLWSLGIEEQFYILWPVMLWLAWKGKGAYLLLILSLGLLSFALNVQQASTDAVAAFYLPFSRFWELLTGATLAAITLRPGQSVVAQRTSYLASVAGMTLIGAGFLLIDKRLAFPGWWALLPALGTALVIWAGPHAWLNRVVLANRVLVWFGLISFPLYLWHWPALSFLRIVEGTEIAQWKRAAAVAVAIVLAWLTYELIEKSIRYRRSWVVTVALSVLMGGVGLAGASGYLSSGFQGRAGAPRVVNFGDIGHLPFFSYIHKQYFPCTPKGIAQDAGDWNGYMRCFQSKDSDVRDVVLLGNSHAEQLFPGLAAQLSESNVVFYGKGGLPFLENKEFSRIFEVLASDKNIKIVLISANWTDELRKLSDAMWKKQLSRTIVFLTSSGKQVFLIEDLPRFSFIPSRCKYEGRFGVFNLCAESDHHDNLKYMDEFEALANEMPEVKTIKTYNMFCDQGKCSMAQGGELLYRDDNHLNVAGSNLVAKAIIQQMGRDEH